MLDIGVSVSYPTVVISALTGLNNETNPNELLRMTAVEASWMGKLKQIQFDFKLRNRTDKADFHDFFFITMECGVFFIQF